MATQSSAHSPKNLLGTFSPGSTHWVGDGFHVRNLFPSNALGERLSSFLMLDYAGPTRFEPTERARGVGLHPHRGFETVTIVYQGQVAHRDSAGNSGVIGPGDVQWMTAAGGVVHEELHAPEFARRGGMLQMVQLWINLPARHKLSTPKYQGILAADIPEVSLGSNGMRARLIAGRLHAEDRGPVGPASTFTPVNVWDVRAGRGAAGTFRLPPTHTAAVVVLEGSARVNGSAPLGEARLALLDRGGELVSMETEADSLLLVLSGEPLGEPVVSHGPFVMNTPAEIRQAFADYQSGRMGHLSEPPREEARVPEPGTLPRVSSDRSGPRRA